MSEKQSQEFNFISVLMFLFRWRVVLIIVFAVSALASVIFSGERFITPKYEGKVVFYPSTTSSVSRSLLSQRGGDRSDHMEFGEEEHAEQILQILESDQVTFRMIDRFNLMEHYRINPDRREANTRLLRRYYGNVSFRRTPYRSIEIRVLDEDPEMAADMANRLSEYIDTVKNNILRARSYEALTIVEREYFNKRDEMRESVDSLRAIGRLGVMNYEEQAKSLNEEITKLRSQYLVQRALLGIMEEGDKLPDSDEYSGAFRTRRGVEAQMLSTSARIKELEKEMEVLSEFGPNAQALSDGLAFEAEKLSDLREKFHQARVDAEQAMSHIFVVDQAYPAEQKAYPVRSLIVLASVFGSLVFAIIVLLLYENIKQAVHRLKSQYDRL